MPDVALIQAQSRQIEFYGDESKPNGSSSKSSAAGQGWSIKVSPVVAGSANPIRTTFGAIKAHPRLTSKTFIDLGLGDPTHYPLHPPPPAAIPAVEAALKSGKANGYVPGVGTLVARQAVADFHLREDGVHYLPSDFVLTHGVSHALDLVFQVLVPPQRIARSNVLLPRPGFSQYPMLLSSLGTDVRFYDCVEENGWEIDLDMLDRLCDDETRVIVITNPSNPCGSNFSKSHLQDILSIAEKHKVPIIADEIYGYMTWTAPFYPMAALSNSVPIITLSGLSKRFLVPGWRVGWAAVHDPCGVAGAIKEGMATWSGRFFGPSSILQAALPAILDTPREWHNQVLQKIKTNAHIVTEFVAAIPGLSCQRPSGALYTLIRIHLDVFPHLPNDVAFSTALYQEEAVLVLPGSCFDKPGYVRLVMASPAEVMKEVGERLEEFCARHMALPRA